MSITFTVKRWLRNLLRKEHNDEFLTGVSSTPDFPDPASLVTWILMSYRRGVDKAACFSFECVDAPFVRLVYDNPVDIIVHYSPPFSPGDRLKAIGLPLPKGFTLTDWKRHDQFTLTGPKIPPNDMAAFLDLLFRKLYRAEKDYVIAAWTDIEPLTPTHQPTKSLHQKKMSS